MKWEIRKGCAVQGKEVDGKGGRKGGRVCAGKPEHVDGGCDLKIWIERTRSIKRARTKGRTLAAHRHSNICTRPSTHTGILKNSFY